MTDDGPEALVGYSVKGTRKSLHQEALPAIVVSEWVTVHAQVREVCGAGVLRMFMSNRVRSDVGHPDIGQQHLGHQHRFEQLVVGMKDN